MLRVERVHDITIVRVHSDVDIATAPQFEAALEMLRDEFVVVIDLVDCPYFDSSGFAVLYRAIREQHLVLSMAEACPIRRLFDIVGAGQLFPIYASETDALGAARRLLVTGELLPTDGIA